MTKLSIIIPVYNERHTVSEILRRVRAVQLSNIGKEIIVIDDGSKDGTREILKKLHGIKLIFHDSNLGKGGALRTGFKASTGDIIIIQDADLEYDPNDYMAMIQPILDGRTQIVLGDRIETYGDILNKKAIYFIGWIGNKVITFVTNWLYWNNAHEYSACYKAFTKKVLNEISVKANDFAFEHELVCRALKLGYKTIDVPIKYYPRSYEEGKKINWRHGIRIIWTVFWIRILA